MIKVPLSMDISLKKGFAYVLSNGTVIVIYDIEALSERDCDNLGIDDFQVAIASNSRKYTLKGKAIEEGGDYPLSNLADVLWAYNASHIPTEWQAPTIDLQVNKHYLTTSGSVVKITGCLPTQVTTGHSLVLFTALELVNNHWNTVIYTRDGRGVYGYNSEGEMNPLPIVQLIPDRVDLPLTKSED